MTRRASESETLSPEALDDFGKSYKAARTETKEKKLKAETWLKLGIKAEEIKQTPNEWSKVNNVRYMAVRFFLTQHRIIFLGITLQSFAIGYFEFPLFQTILLKSSIRSSGQDPIRAVFIFCKHKRARLCHFQRNLIERYPRIT